MFAKVLSWLGALVIIGATVLVTAEPAHAHPRGGYHRQVAAVRGYHHGGHYWPPPRQVLRRVPTLRPPPRRVLRRVPTLPSLRWRLSLPLRSLPRLRSQRLPPALTLGQIMEPMGDPHEGVFHATVHAAPETHASGGGPCRPLPGHSTHR